MIRRYVVENYAAPNCEAEAKLITRGLGTFCAVGRLRDAADELGALDGGGFAAQVARCSM
jgi:hypothetical protein